MWSSWQETVVELHPNRSRAPPGCPSHRTWSALTWQRISTSSPEAPGNSSEWGQGGKTCLSRPSSWAMGLRVERAEDWRWQRPLRPFLEHFLLPSRHLTVLSAEKKATSVLLQWSSSLTCTGWTCFNIHCCCNWSLSCYSTWHLL